MEKKGEFTKGGISAEFEIASPLIIPRDVWGERVDKQTAQCSLITKYEVLLLPQGCGPGQAVFGQTLLPNQEVKISIPCKTGPRIGEQDLILASSKVAGGGALDPLHPPGEQGQTSPVISRLTTGQNYVAMFGKHLLERGKLYEFKGKREESAWNPNKKSLSTHVFYELMQHALLVLSVVGFSIEIRDGKTRALLPIKGLEGFEGAAPAYFAQGDPRASQVVSKVASFIHQVTSRATDYRYRTFRDLPLARYRQPYAALLGTLLDPQDTAAGLTNPEIQGCVVAVERVSYLIPEGIMCLAYVGSKTEPASMQVFGVDTGRLGSPPPPVPREPFPCPPDERQYYVDIHGFDPEAGWVNKALAYKYEAWFQLVADPALAAVGVTIGARVDQVPGLPPQNRILFRSKEGNVEGIYCTHTVLYAGPADDALRFADDSILQRVPVPAELDFLAQTGGPVQLPPWGHFAALKSYVAGIAEMGILTMMGAASAQDREGTLPLTFGFNPAMQRQVIGALRRIAPLATDAIVRDYFLQLLEEVPPEWLTPRLQLLDGDLNLCPVIFADPAIVQAVLARIPAMALSGLVLARPHRNFSQYEKGLDVLCAALPPNDVIKLKERLSPAVAVTETTQDTTNISNNAAPLAAPILAQEFYEEIDNAIKMHLDQVSTTSTEVLPVTEEKKPPVSPGLEQKRNDSKTGDEAGT